MGSRQDGSGSISRRDLLRGLGFGAVVGPLLGEVDLKAIERIATRPEVAEGVRPGPSAYRLSVNGREVEVKAEPRVTLLEVLRDRLGLTGTKQICDRGACGGCTVLLDGAPVNSCLLLALDARGRAVRTIEGLGRPGALDPVQSSFIEKDALMCGYCTPGMILCVRALLDRNPSPDREDVRRAVSGNLCRCGTYPHVFEAALAAARRAGGKGDGGP